MKQSIGVIGSGFSGMASAALLAQAGSEVVVYEKNDVIGGRASSMSVDGFHFDKGPSWYWMPDVFDEFFEKAGFDRKKLFKLQKLDPGFRVFFGREDFVDIPADYDALRQTFESMEKGSARNLDRFMDEAEQKYRIGISEMARMPGVSIMEFASLSLLRSAMKMDLFSSVSKLVRSKFKDPRIRMIMEFPVLFLGASAERIPALYTMMNYAGLKQGTFYPEGGFKGVVDAFKTVLDFHGVEVQTGAEVSNIQVANNRVSHLEINRSFKVSHDAIIGAADYAHVEKLLPGKYRNYKESYWKKKVFAPSALLFYVGLNKKLDGIQHHNLFFHSDFERHIGDIYSKPEWPEDPLFYVCNPSKTDPSTAPEGCENLFFLMPVATGLKDTEQIRQKYFEKLVNAFENLTGCSIREHLSVCKSYCVRDFEKEYNAYGGNAYGLANTLGQTAILKPGLKNKRLDNLFYTGQLTVPGPGVPPAIISGEIVATLVQKSFADKSRMHDIKV